MDENLRIQQLAEKIERLKSLELEAIRKFKDLKCSEGNPTHEDIQRSISRIHNNLAKLIEIFHKYELNKQQLKGSRINSLRSSTYESSLVV